MPDRAKNDMGMPYSSTLFFFYPNLSVIGISLVSFFCSVSLRPSARDCAQFHANILGLRARNGVESSMASETLGEF